MDIKSTIADIIREDLAAIWSILNSEEKHLIAENFVIHNYRKGQIIYAEKEGSYYEKTKFELGLDSGAKLELDEDGNWEKVENKVDGVPAIFVPKEIADYIKTKYATVAVTKVDKEDGGFEVELSNRKELKFNKRFKLVKVDN